MRPNAHVQALSLVIAFAASLEASMQRAPLPPSSCTSQPVLARAAVTPIASSKRSTTRAACAARPAIAIGADPSQRRNSNSKTNAVHDLHRHFTFDLTSDHLAVRFVGYAHAPAERVGTENRDIFGFSVLVIDARSRLFGRKCVLSRDGQNDWDGFDFGGNNSNSGNCEQIKNQNQTTKIL